MGSTQPNRVNEKGKDIRVEVDDDDYIPLDHEDDTDDESFEIVDDAAYQCHENDYHSHLFNLRTSVIKGDRRTKALGLVGPRLKAQVPSRRPHGLTRGLKVQAMVEKDGKLKVPIPHEYRAPVGDHASQLVSRIGIEVRTRLQASWSFLRNKVSKERASHELVDCFLDNTVVEGLLELISVGVPRGW
ncbi:hypothetical protein TEA_009928 [Camellia sinensis var. sinensis]|uniref:Uncharacterized protein n=1 Tax=Camellia sinensis var. sinensis TaxID=542762 RepID=A0A4S4D1R7_CAMSN|nr:hypothetical protein TEA_009928 [Camellia sinensis var. sinensis]